MLQIHPTIMTSSRGMFRRTRVPVLSDVVVIFFSAQK